MVGADDVVALVMSIAHALCPAGGYGLPMPKGAFYAARCVASRESGVAQSSPGWISLSSLDKPHQPGQASPAWTSLTSLDKPHEADQPCSTVRTDTAAKVRPAARFGPSLGRVAARIKFQLDLSRFKSLERRFQTLVNLVDFFGLGPRDSAPHAGRTVTSDTDEDDLRRFLLESV